MYPKLQIKMASKFSIALLKQRQSIAVERIQEENETMPSEF